jgi:hypothetical protein
MNQAHENSAIELHDPRHQHRTQSTNDVSTAEASTTATSLPAADGGLAAWRLLIAAFVFEALLWGQSSSPTMLTSLTNAPANQVSHSASASSKRTTPRCLNSRTHHTLPSSEPSRPECRTSLRRSLSLSSSATRDIATS